jgi:type I restriction-modification system DNA methylase subunit
MSAGNSTGRKAQLGKSERDQLEDVVVDLRETIEEEIEYELEHHYGLTEREGGEDLSEEEQDTRERLVDAIDHENPDDKSWDWCYQQYITGVGYTIVNRLAAFRCMEVRGFLDQPVTQIGDSGLTPAAEQLLGERFDLGREEALVAAYHEECEAMAEEIEILFDPDSRYSVIDPDPDLFRNLVGELDEISDDVWRADDVLGWVYEYYNRPVVERLEDKNTLEAEEVAPANQFYTPHWVVRLLTDNSLGRLYLEEKGEVDAVVEAQSDLTTDERKQLPTEFDEANDIAEFCTYLLPNQESGEPTDFDHPEELRVLDPACGSGHFLLYAFDVLERIWRRECPKIDTGAIPRKILEHNLYGVDLDLRACQLATFNLYLKARDRAETEGNTDFELPRMGIVTADAKVANTDDISEIFEELSGEHDELEEALQTILDSFENIEALGTLLDVKGTLEDVFDTGEQQTLLEAINGTGDLHSVLENLQQSVDDRFDDDSFDAQEIRSFLRLLGVLTQDYDVALMNPPYGSKARMPKPVRKYVKEHWEYPTEYYINFFEVCDQLSKTNGRVGMLVKREFMFKNSLADFRQDFIGERGSFDFLAEFGEGVLDKAKVRNAASVVRTDAQKEEEVEGTFIRLHDVAKEEKETKLLDSVYDSPIDGEVQRVYSKKLSEFKIIPGSHMSYWASKRLRSIFDSEIIFDDSNVEAGKDSFGTVSVGLQTGCDPRFTRYHWETNSDRWVPFAKGGEDAWTLPRINLQLLWEDDGREVRSYEGSYPRNSQDYFSEALTYTYMKSSGRRFGYLHPSSVFGHAGNVFLPDSASWKVMGYGNSHLVTYLMACLDPGRHWEVGNVSKLPWYSGLAELEGLESQTRKIAGHLLYQRMSDFDSPYYTSPELLRHLAQEDPLWLYESHPHRELIDKAEMPEFDSDIDLATSLYNIAIHSSQITEEIDTRLDQFGHEIDTAVFDFFDLDDELREEVLTEISLRTNENPELNPEFEAEEITEPQNYETLIKDLVLHFAVKAILESEDGIVPTEAQHESYESLLELVIDQFERVWGEHSAERLNEVDDQLGDQQSSGIAYPNLQRWLQEDLFEYHLDRFENTPILWRLTSQRLTSDGDAEGFGCFVDYHRFDQSTFDRIQSIYLEDRKSVLNDLRSSANRRRNDESLNSAERAEAKEEFDQYENQRRQVDGFEEQLLELTQAQEREWSQENQELAADLVNDIELLRERLNDRMEAFEELVEISSEEWLADTFTDTFTDYVLDEKEEWFTALDGGIEAAERYAKSADSPVEPHLYDYLNYCEDNIGTTSYYRNGLLFLHHYFGDDEFRGLVEDGEPREGMDKQETLLARLAAGIDRDAEIGERIKERCDELQSKVEITWDEGCSSDWEGRALDEIMTGGYDPVKKHGVAVNIRPLAVQQIVPEIVEDDVLL